MKTSQASKIPPTARLKRILKLLQKTYGPRPWQYRGRAVPVLVETILSQNTSNSNSAAGYRQLWRQFRSWNKVADAPVAEVERHIRVSGLSNIKAPRIQNILRQIRTAHGKIDLEFLQGWKPEAAYQYLRHFHGVGPKTANCVLLFSFNMPLFPVDTHIHRIALRLGLIPPRTSAEEAHDLLTPMIAPKDRYALHVLLITHGRKICKAGRPLCPGCPILRLCPEGKKRMLLSEHGAGSDK